MYAVLRIHPNAEVFETVGLLLWVVPWRRNVLSICPSVDLFLAAVVSWFIPVRLGLPVSGCCL